jgi:hypothetical protein
MFGEFQFGRTTNESFLQMQHNKPFAGVKNISGCSFGSPSFGNAFMGNSEKYVLFMLAQHHAYGADQSDLQVLIC